MEFRIADTFTDSLGRLTADEQKAVKTTAFDLQLDPSRPGMQIHRLDRVRDPNFWSVRVSRDIRLIVHRTESSFLLCYVAHHDDAYDWAERRKLETHPTTGAAQLVELRELVREIPVVTYVNVEEPSRLEAPLFADRTDEELLAYGVPAGWLEEVRLATDSTLFELLEHLPGEAAEALLDLATGATPTVVTAVAAEVSPFEHPDARRRFRTVTNVEELERALDAPWDRWTIFLHPTQRQTVERDYGGPARVSGSAGTGKTIVALHRAVHLARTNPEARVLLTTFSEPLANALRARLRRLISNEPIIAERLEVHAIDTIARRLHERLIGRPELATREEIERLLRDAAAEDGGGVGLRFLVTEWTEVVDAWQLGSWEEYRDVLRLGRKTRLPEKRREALWRLFERVRSELTAAGKITTAEMFKRVAERLAAAAHPAFDFVVLDEAQDVSVAQLRFLAALAGDRENGLFLAGDLGQRIFQQPFSWKSLGVDIRGRSSMLRVNYRTSHQIRAQADRLLPPEVADVDGNREGRSSISVFNGPDPLIRSYKDAEEEIRAVGEWLSSLGADGIPPHEMGVFVRSTSELDRAIAAAEAAGLSFRVLDEGVETVSGHVSISTMHLAKGLEFRAVAVMACDDDVIPSQERIEAVSDDSDLEEVYNTERHLLYVACTRARDQLLVTSAGPASEFLDDLRVVDTT